MCVSCTKTSQVAGGLSLMLACRIQVARALLLHEAARQKADAEKQLSMQRGELEEERRRIEGERQSLEQEARNQRVIDHTNHHSTSQV